jgi:hypothetical protein
VYCNKNVVGTLLMSYLGLYCHNENHAVEGELDNFLQNNESISASRFFSVFNIIKDATQNPNALTNECFSREYPGSGQPHEHLEWKCFIVAMQGTLGAI